MLRRLRLHNLHNLWFPRLCFAGICHRTFMLRCELLIAYVRVLVYTLYYRTLLYVVAYTEGIFK